jgi:hypothetical protein
MMLRCLRDTGMSLKQMRYFIGLAQGSDEKALRAQSTGGTPEPFSPDPLVPADDQSGPGASMGRRRFDRIIGMSYLFDSVFT